MADLGLAGIFVLMALDAACIPIPSEATMLFGGFTVSQGHNSIVSVTVAGVLGNLVGSWLAFWVRPLRSPLARSSGPPPTADRPPSSRRRRSVV